MIFAVFTLYPSFRLRVFFGGSGKTGSSEGSGRTGSCGISVDPVAEAIGFPFDLFPRLFFFGEFFGEFDLFPRAFFR